MPSVNRVQALTFLGCELLKLSVLWSAKTEYLFFDMFHGEHPLTQIILYTL